MFLRLNINANGRIGDAEETMTSCLVNMDQVLTVSPHTGSDGKTKLRFEDGHSLICGQSLDYIFASLNGTLGTGYKAPEPKDA